MIKTELRYANQVSFLISADRWSAVCFFTQNRMALMKARNV